MKKIFQLSQVVVVMVMSVFLFSCEKSEMDGVIPTAQAEAKKGKNTQAMHLTQQNNQQADSVFIVTFYDTNNTLNTEADVQNLATNIGGAITFDQTYWEGTKGFAAPLTASQVYIFRHDSRVEFVEADGPIYPLTNP
jgi:hypothetical protein